MKLISRNFSIIRLLIIIFTFQEDVNVICVDWSAGAADPNYVRAAVNTRLVGRQVALLIESINNSNDGKKINDKIHIIGFSLGAHVAGFAGHQLKNLSRITGSKLYIIEKFREIAISRKKFLLQGLIQLDHYSKDMIPMFAWIKLMLIM